MKHDAQAGVRSTAILLGRRWARREYSALIAGAYVITLGMIAFGILPLWSLLTLLTIPLAVNNVKAAFKDHAANPESLAVLDVRTAQLHSIFGILLMISIFPELFL